MFRMFPGTDIALRSIFEQEMIEIECVKIPLSRDNGIFGFYLKIIT